MGTIIPLRMLPDDYNEVALKVAPVGERPTLEKLRRTVAKVLSEEVNKALERQLVNMAPEIEATKTGLKTWQAGLKSLEETLAKRALRLKDREEALSELDTAMINYFSWFDSVNMNDVLEVKPRFEKMRQCHERYRNTKG